MCQTRPGPGGLRFEVKPIIEARLAGGTWPPATTDGRRRERNRAEEKAEQETRDEKRERKIDRDLEDSFPASDPPGWTLGVEREN